MKAVSLLLTLAWAIPIHGVAETPENTSTGSQVTVTQQTIDRLLAVIAAHEARIQDLSVSLAMLAAALPAPPQPPLPRRRFQSPHRP